MAVPPAGIEPAHAPRRRLRRRLKLVAALPSRAPKRGRWNAPGKNRPCARPLRYRHGAAYRLTRATHRKGASVNASARSQRGLIPRQVDGYCSVSRASQLRSRAAMASTSTAGGVWVVVRSAPKRRRSSRYARSLQTCDYSPLSADKHLAPSRVWPGKRRIRRWRTRPRF